MHCIFNFSGLLKNRPALGELAVRELLADNILKINYFLTDVRGRVVKSYMKIPIPSVNDPDYEIFVENLTKHDINVDEYQTVYKNSSIPPNNDLSSTALKVFETNASLVSEYKKYEIQLHRIVQNHVENRNIEENDDGQFVVLNKAAFPHQFCNVENLVPSNRNDKTRGTSKLLRYVTGNLLKEIFDS